MNLINRHQAKIAHFAVSFVIVVIGAAFTLPFGMLISFLAGLGKEIHDYAEKGFFSWRDMGYNLAGIITASLWILIFMSC